MPGGNMNADPNAASYAWCDRNNIARPSATVYAAPTRKRGSVLRPTTFMSIVRTLTVMALDLLTISACLYFEIGASPPIPNATRLEAASGLLVLVAFRAASMLAFRTSWSAILAEMYYQPGLLMSLLLVIDVLTPPSLHLSPQLALVGLAASLTLIIVARCIRPRAAKAGLSTRLLRRRLVFLGQRSAVYDAIANLNLQNNENPRVVGIFLSDHSIDPDERFIADLIEFGKANPVDQVLLTRGTFSSQQLDHIVNQLKSLNVDVALYPCLAGSTHSRNRPVLIGGLPVSLVATRPIRRLGLLAKDLEDKVMASALLLWLSPLLLIIAVVIWLDDPGPVLFRQRRHGLNNVEFEILKFRTMAAIPAGLDIDLQQTRRNDTRVTRVGRFLRKTSLDELPQLFNVLRGDMSLVGPRPHPVTMRTENQLGSEIIADYRHRHRVKPGMTGWAQINGFRGATQTVDEIRRRVEYDMFYINNWSILFDLKILALTPIKVILSKGAAF
jgi:Undecaprenyl-phosphate glucose phosphotransferase